MLAANDHAPCTCRQVVVCLCIRSRHMKLRLIEQRLRLLLHGARCEAASRCVLVSAAGSRVEEESACRQ